MAWYDKQKAILGKYRRMSLIPDAEYRALLHEVTGCSSSTDGKLTQADFDWFMARFEADLLYRVREGFCAAPPAKVDINYWRGRLAKNGEANKRMTHLVYNLWGELKTMLKPESRTDDYLRAIAAQANRRPVRSIAELKGWQICVTIEALKARIFQTRKTLAADRAGLPGAGVAPETETAVTVDTEDSMPGEIVVEPAMDEVPF